MASRPCVQCPFRAGSLYRYDADAVDALNDENTPACHMQVGVDSVFAHAPLSPPGGTECAGHALWLNDTPGYDLPAATHPETP